MQPVFDHLRQRGQSEKVLDELRRDVLDIPAQYARRMRRENKGEYTRRLGDLAQKTRRLAREWDRDPGAKVWTLLPELTDTPEGRRYTVVTNMRCTNLPTVGEQLRSLADALEHEGGRELPFEPLFRRKPPLTTYAVIWCAVRLTDTGVYARTPHAHAAILASAAVNLTVTTEQAKKIIARARKR